MMRYIFLYLFLIVSTFICHAQNDRVKVFKDSIHEALHNCDFVLASGLLSDPQTKQILGENSFLGDFLHISLLAQRSEVSPDDKKLVDELVLEQSQDSVFYSKFLKTLYDLKEYDYLERNLDQYINRYPNSKRMYLYGKAKVYIARGDLARSEAFYEEILTTDGLTYEDYWIVGEQQVEYAFTKNTKEEALIYYRKGMTNLRKAYDLLPEDYEIMRKRIGYKLQNLVSMLFEEQITQDEEVLKYMEGIDFIVSPCYLCF